MKDRSQHTRSQMASAGEVDGQRPSPAERHLRVREDLSLHVLEWRPAHRSASPAFVLVHGLASNARTWDGVAIALESAGYLVRAVDLRGHGGSDRPDAGYDVPSVAEDICLLLRHLATEDGVASTVLVGQSWGGNVVMEAAARCPARIAAVVGVDGGTIHLAREFPDWPQCAAALAPPPIAGTPAADFERWLRTAHPDWPETGIQGTLANVEQRPDGTVAPWLTRERHLAVLRGLWEHDPTLVYPRITAPVLLVGARNGRDDHARAVAREDRLDAAVRGLSSAQVAWFDGADHDIHAQRPAELAATMLAFAASSTGSPR
jgi:pimeloyl-ACP methyl ester carboxylesterase